MLIDRSYFSLTKFAAAIVLGMCVLAASVVFGVNYAVDRAVSIDARTRADDWAKYFINTLPDLDHLLATGKLDERQAAVVSTAAKVGNVFRFKIYDAKGNTILESDAETFDREADEEHLDDDAFEVVESKQSVISLNDGTNERNMPALYAEAYVPVLKANGEIRTIIETYVDETRIAAFFKTTFQTLAIVLGLGMAFAFGAPTLAFLLRTKQAREVKQRVEFLASHDPMTNLLNRASFSELLLRRIASRPAGRCLAVAFVDVDDFKFINDSYGHEAGDGFLKHVARSVTAFCEEDDFIARAGGDEFVVAVARASETEVVAAVEAMMAAIREPMSACGHRIVGRVSAGVHLLSGTAASVEDALHCAEVALYQSKVDGKNTVRRFSEEMEGRTRARREMEQLVREAAANGRFELHYQPLVDAHSERCLGFEALLRLKDQNGVYVPPITFIPIAESIGLIEEIGQWVIEEATRTAALWPVNMFVSINLSVRQFASEQLVGVIKMALVKSGLAPGRLELEVTESLLMENTEMVARQLAAIKAFGVSLAMDDFGTGYSSLSYLWQFGFDKLKIDRSFVTALNTEEDKARDILDTIINLAHRLDMKVTAEGIETGHQAGIIAALACDQFQGYLYGGPMPMLDIAPYLLRQVQANAEVLVERKQTGSGRAA